MFVFLIKNINIRNIYISDNTIIESKKENTKEQNINSPIFDKYKIKSIKIEKLSGIEEHPKNRYKSKLQKILLKKQCKNFIQKKKSLL